MTMTLNRPVEPWYRQFWPWFLMSLPAIAVVAGFATLWVAIESNDGLVVDDYYKEGLAIKQTMERSEEASRLGITADVNLTSDRVTVALSAKDPAVLTEHVRLLIAHPTRAGFDQKVELQGLGGNYSGEIQPLSFGRWKLQIENDSRTWRLNAEVRLPTQTVIHVTPVEIKSLE